MATTEFYTDLDLKSQQIKNARVENDTTLGTGKTGQVKFLTAKDGDNEIGFYYFDGSAWIRATPIGVTKAIDTRVASLEAQVGTSGEGTLAGRVESLETELETLSGTVSTNSASISTNAGAISNLTTEVGKVKSTADSAKTLAEANKTAIGDEATSSSILGRIKTAEGEIDTLQSEMTTAKNDISNAKTDISALKGTVGNASSGLVKDVADNTSAISALQTTVGSESSGLVKTVNDLDAAYKDADSKLGTRIKTIEDDYLKATTAASTYRTINDSYTKTEVDDAVKSALSSAYTVQGSLTAAELQSLPADKKQNGYVYNIKEAFTLDIVQYPAGTNVVWVVDKTSGTGSWDVLAGLGDFHEYAKTEDVISKIATAKTEAINAAGTATDTKLQSYVPKTTTVNGHALSANVTITKSDVELGNVDNTSDADKPVSTAQQAALDKKADAVATGKGTWTGKITVNEQGIVTAGANLTAADVPALTASKITDFASAAVAAGKVVFPGVSMTVSESWQNVGDTAIGAYPSAITAYHDGVVVGVAFKYDSSNDKIQYQVNEPITVTVVVSL